MPKRKAAAPEAASGDAEEVKDAEAPANDEAASPAKKTKEAAKKGGRGRGRPPLSAEEKAKRNAAKGPKSGRGRGRPKGSTATKKGKGKKK